MLSIVIFLIIVFMFVGWILTLMHEKGSNKPLGLFGGIIGVWLPAVFMICYVLTCPTAMDVYQGKTTLEITYKDSVAVDSAVVFKRDIK